MKQNQTFNWAVAWIFTVIVFFAVMQDAGFRRISKGIMNVMPYNYIYIKRKNG